MTIAWVDENIDNIASDMSRFHDCWIDPEQDIYVDRFGNPLMCARMLSLTYRLSGYEDSLVRKAWIEENYMYDEETGEYTKRAQVTDEVTPDGCPVLAIRSELMDARTEMDLSDFMDFE